MPENIFRRCHHIITENDRVLEATVALQQNNFDLLGKLIYQSHFSLQKNFEVSCKELDYLVQQTIDKKYVLGSRMMGGGFGGCTINLIDKKKVDEFIECISPKYKEQFGIKLSPYFVSIEDGTSLG